MYDALLHWNSSSNYNGEGDPPECTKCGPLVNGIGSADTPLILGWTVSALRWKDQNSWPPVGATLFDLRIYKVIAADISQRDRYKYWPLTFHSWSFFGSVWSQNPDVDQRLGRNPFTRGYDVINKRFPLQSKKFLG